MGSKQKLWTLREVAAYLRRHPDSVRSLVDGGHIKAVNCGTEKRRVWCFTEEAVQEFVQRRTHNGQQHQSQRAKMAATKRLDELLSK